MSWFINPKKNSSLYQFVISTINHSYSTSTLTTRHHHGPGWPRIAPLSPAFPNRFIALVPVQGLVAVPFPALAILLTSVRRRLGRCWCFSLWMDEDVSWKNGEKMDGIWRYMMIYAYGWYYWETQTIKNLLTLFESDSDRLSIGL